MVKTLSTNITLVSFAAAGAVAAVGCVDARGAYDDFSGRVVDAGTDDVDGATVSELPDVDGEWLVAVRPNLPEDRIIQFRTTFEITPVTSNTGTISFSAQPLTVADRTPVGEALTAVDAAVGSDATFRAPLAGMLPGPANPVTMTEVAIDATMNAELRSDDFLCGTLEGTAGALPLQGTTWAAIRITGDDLPDYVVNCDGAPL